jgi:hypothetical protein
LVGKKHRTTEILENQSAQGEAGTNLPDGTGGFPAVRLDVLSDIDQGGYGPGSAGCSGIECGRFSLWLVEREPGAKTAAAANLILFLLVGPLLLFSEAGPHYRFIPFGVLVSAILIYGQYRHLKAPADSPAATGQEESTEEAEVVITGSDDERVDKEE